MNLSRLCSEIEKKPTYLGYVELSNEVDSLNTATKTDDPYRVAILRNFTIEPVMPVLKGEFFLAGTRADFFIGDFDTIANDVMNPGSGFYTFQPQLVILAQWFELLSPAVSHSFITLSLSEKEEEMKRIVRDLKNILMAIRKNSKVPVIINNFPLPVTTTLGILDNQSPHSQKKWFAELNNWLIKLCAEIDNVFCLDLNALFLQVGYANGYSQRQWEMSKAPLAQKILIPLGREYAKFFRALNGNAKKCLVLDCDGTLWGGVLGEDGPDGIKLGTTYPGSSYVHFQQQILNLYSRGIILAICSKNNEEDVLDILENHESMILKKHHFAIWKINWEDKASGMLQIAKELNIGIDSLVFADDNEFECDWIKSQLPEVKVLHLNGDPSLFESQLLQTGYFDSLSFSEEDRTKTEMYISDKKRNDLFVSTGSYEDYLEELGIKAIIQPVRTQDMVRVSQLTQKTNQFNLTTIRYTEADIRQIAEAGNNMIFTLAVSDKISDLGLIGVAIVKYENNIAVIDSFLMSCRALGRGLETALLIYIIQAAAAEKKRSIKARYVSSKKNIQTKDFYSRHDFALLSEADNSTEWEFDLLEKKIMPYPKWLTVN
jgi:FkbH-like protein